MPWHKSKEVNRRGNMVNICLGSTWNELIRVRIRVCGKDNCNSDSSNSNLLTIYKRMWLPLRGQIEKG